MDKRRKIDEEVRKTMEVFDRMERVEGNPFLMTRLEEKMQTSSGVRRPRLAIQWAMLALLLLVNVFVLISQQETGVDSASLETEIAEEYGWSEEASLYDFYSQN